MKTLLAAALLSSAAFGAFASEASEFSIPSQSTLSRAQVEFDLETPASARAMQYIGDAALFNDQSIANTSHALALGSGLTYVGDAAVFVDHDRGRWAAADTSLQMAGRHCALRPAARRYCSAVASTGNNLIRPSDITSTASAARIRPISRVITLMPVLPSTLAMRPDMLKASQTARPITTP